KAGLGPRAVPGAPTNWTNSSDSGGPLFNKKGELVGVTESGHLGGSQAMSLFIDVTEVRAFFDLKRLTITESGIDPKQDKVVPKKDSATEIPPAKEKDTMPAATEADEKAAAARLASAKLFREGEENRDTYKSKLNAIVRQYPNTAAAKEAKRLLDALK